MTELQFNNDPVNPSAADNPASTQVGYPFTPIQDPVPAPMQFPADYQPAVDPAFEQPVPAPAFDHVSPMPDFAHSMANPAFPQLQVQPDFAQQDSMPGFVPQTFMSDFGQPAVQQDFGQPAVQSDYAQAAIQPDFAQAAIQPDYAQPADLDFIPQAEHGFPEQFGQPDSAQPLMQPDYSQSGFQIDFSQPPAQPEPVQAAIGEYMPPTAPAEGISDDLPQPYDSGEALADEQSPAPEEDDTDEPDSIGGRVSGYRMHSFFTANLEADSAMLEDDDDDEAEDYDDIRSSYAFMQNRELSWLTFDERVLDQGADESVPLLDRLNFISIFWSNLQEFFMVRVGSLTDLSFIDPPVRDSKTGLTPSAQIKAIHERCRELYPIQESYYEHVRGSLAKEGVRHLRPDDLSDEQRNYLSGFVKFNVEPFLSPQIINPRHPFPHLENGKLYILVRLDDEADAEARKKDKKDKKSKKKKDKGGAEGVVLGLIPLPHQCDRIIKLPGRGFQFILLEHAIEMFAPEIFSMYTIKHTNVICVTRNADIDANQTGDEQDEDYREHMKRLLKKRARLAPVRLECERPLSPVMEKLMLKKLGLKRSQVYDTIVPLDLSFTWGLGSHLTEKKRAKLSNPPFAPAWPVAFDHKRRILDQVSDREVLLSYPYESMDPFVQLLKEAAFDPSVISIKITLYRLASQSQLAEALITAAENGKSVTALFELRARFDESNNIEWSQRFEQAGCNVIYGFRDYKVHSKICCITRHLPDGSIQHITQLGTGNYNEKTAKLYTDLSFITTDETFGKDAVEFFRNMQLENVSDNYEVLRVAPLQIKPMILSNLDRQIELARAGKPCGAFMKANSITDKDVIEKIAEASQAGVGITLFIRGICCLVPEVKGFTDNVRVVSIVGRLLEHSRIYCFGTPDDCVMYLSSADLMTRNLNKRVEIAWPILSEKIRWRILDYIDICLHDTAKLRELRPNATYTPLGAFCDLDEEGNSQPAFDAQSAMITRAAEAAERAQKAEAEAEELEAGDDASCGDEQLPDASKFAPAHAAFDPFAVASAEVGGMDFPDEQENGAFDADTPIIAEEGTELVEPRESFRPVEPAVPAEPFVPFEPSVAVEPIIPVMPTESVMRAMPAEPAAPVMPVMPVEPIMPAEPVEPVERIMTAMPAGPVMPVEPFVPFEPAVPVEAAGADGAFGAVVPPEPSASSGADEAMVQPASAGEFGLAEALVQGMAPVEGEMPEPAGQVAQAGQAEAASAEAKPLGFNLEEALNSDLVPVQTTRGELLGGFAATDGPASTIEPAPAAEPAELQPMPAEQAESGTVPVGPSEPAAAPAELEAAPSLDELLVSSIERSQPLEEVADQQPKRMPAHAAHPSAETSEPAEIAQPAMAAQEPAEIAQPAMAQEPTDYISRIGVPFDPSASRAWILEPAVSETPQEGPAASDAPHGESDVPEPQPIEADNPEPLPVEPALPDTPSAGRSGNLQIPAVNVEGTGNADIPLTEMSLEDILAPLGDELPPDQAEVKLPQAQVAEGMQPVSTGEPAPATPQPDQTPVQAMPANVAAAPVAQAQGQPPATSAADDDGPKDFFEGESRNLEMPPQKKGFFSRLFD